MQQIGFPGQIAQRRAKAVVPEDIDLPGAIINDATPFKTKHGMSHRHHGGTYQLIRVDLVQGGVDTTVQASVDIIIAGVSALDAPKQLSGAADTEVNAALNADSAKLLITEGQVLEFPITGAGTGDGQDLAISLSWQAL